MITMIMMMMTIQTV